MTAPSPDMTERQLYTVREFCRRNSIGKTTFYELVSAGEIELVHVGRRSLVPARSERAWHERLGICTHKSAHTEPADLGGKQRTMAAVD